MCIVYIAAAENIFTCMSCQLKYSMPSNIENCWFLHGSNVESPKFRPSVKKIVHRFVQHWQIFFVQPPMNGHYGEKGNKKINWDIITKSEVVFTKNSSTHIFPFFSKFFWMLEASDGLLSWINQSED